MGFRPETESVARVDGPPEDAAERERKLDDLRQRHPGALFARYLERVPQTRASTYVAPGAAIVGDVRLFADVSVWFGCVLRADLSWIEIRERSNVQDGTIVHLGDVDPTFVAEEVVVGHSAVLHGCHVGAGSLVGIGATVLDGAQIGEGCVIGAGALVLAGARIPARSLVLGCPGKVVRQLSATDEKAHRDLALKYTRLAHNYRKG